MNILCRWKCRTKWPTWTRSIIIHPISDQIPLQTLHQLPQPLLAFGNARRVHRDRRVRRATKDPKDIRANKANRGRQANRDHGDHQANKAHRDHPDCQDDPATEFELGKGWNLYKFDGIL